MWQSPFQIFFFSRYLYGSVFFLEVSLSSMVDYLKYSRDASARRDTRFMRRFPFSPRSSCICAHGFLIILGSLIIFRQGP